MKLTTIELALIVYALRPHAFKNEGPTTKKESKILSKKIRNFIINKG